MSRFIELITSRADSEENLPLRRKPYHFIIIEFSSGQEALILEVSPDGSISMKRSSTPIKDLLHDAGATGHASGTMDGETDDYTKRFGPPKFEYSNVKYTSPEELYQEVIKSGQIQKLGTHAQIRFEHLLNPEDNR